ncbi:hypothetical protein HYDPIDRAFT_117855 [Hydnomerulius pinastri MD-312]|uniref:Uncharacterized protein n=1 Tax=Hydnomerulius pinastri MD-312 TaxID=994086 RepID=A0A0C9VQF4_9AGAM|nr:hypothetical protein HYDPIDRAFT_117855 [Hydnomerulius pinastri MD-312]
MHRNGSSTAPSCLQPLWAVFVGFPGPMGQLLVDGMITRPRCTAMGGREHMDCHVLYWFCRKTLN